VANSLNVKVDRIWLIGSSLTYQWTPESDLDVTLFVSKSKDECKELNKLSAKHFNEKIFIKKHPVNFYFDPGRFLKFKSDAIYDLEHDKWIKKPESSPVYGTSVSSKSRRPSNASRSFVAFA
jgi:predicted nucleotidyltransferase